MVISAAYRAQADALLIEARAKVRLADEFDAAQADKKVAGPRDGDRRSNPERLTVADIGLTRKQVHEARQIRDAEKLDPGSVERVLSGRVEAGDKGVISRLPASIPHVLPCLLSYACVHGWNQHRMLAFHAVDRREAGMSGALQRNSPLELLRRSAVDPSVLQSEDPRNLNTLLKLGLVAKHEEKIIITDLGRKWIEELSF